MTARYDPQSRRAAVQIQLRHPNWLILWGPYSREFWAFPLFAEAPPKSFLHAADGQILVSQMAQAEREFRRPPDMPRPW